MTFRARIKPGHGKPPREVEFDFGYDATAVLEQHIAETHLKPGEEIVRIERIA